MLRKKIKIFLVFILLITVSGGIFVLTNRTEAPSLTATKQKTTTVKNTPAETTTVAKPVFDKKARSIDDPVSSWVVVNKARPLNPVSYAPTDLTNIGSGHQLRAEAAAALANMQNAASAEGLTVSAQSGYRSYTTQISVYNNEVKKNGQAVADSQSARPGTSEHQTGWAVDVGGGGCGIEDCFGNTAEGKWVADHAYEYGFIIRYTAASQQVTGYRAEPWHLRYIGTDLSHELYKENIQTLEAFFGLPDAPDYL